MLAGYGDGRARMAIRATASGTMAGGERWVNVLHFAGETIDGTIADAIGDRIRQFYVDFQAQLHSDWHFDSVRLGMAEEADSFEYEMETRPGLATGIPLPNDMSIVINWRSSDPSRRGRGRTFLGGFDASTLWQEGATGPGVVAPSTASDIADAAAGLSSLTAANDLIVYSRASGLESIVTGGSGARRR